MYSNVVLDNGYISYTGPRILEPSFEEGGLWLGAICNVNDEEPCPNWNITNQRCMPEEGRTNTRCRCSPGYANAYNEGECQGGYLIQIK